MSEGRGVLVELSFEEIVQIEEVLLRHRRTSLITELQEKLRRARESIDVGRNIEGN